MLGGRALEVEGDLVIGHGDRDTKLEISFSGLEHVGRVEASVRQAGERGPDGAFRVAEQLVHRRGDALPSAAGAELGDAPLRQPVGGQLRAEVSSPFLGVSHAGDEVVHDGVVEAGRRDHDSFLGERARLGRHAPRLAPADVGVVRACDGEAELRPGDERHVGQMGAAGVRVVEDEDVVP